MSTTGRRGIRATSIGLLTAASVAALAACSPPGTGASSASTTTAAVSTELPSGDVVLDVYLETNFQEAFKTLAAEFTKEHPNVTFAFQSDTFSNLAQNATKIISSPDAPDLMRYPTVSQAAQDGILTNLDPYAGAYGWDSWPQGTLNQVRVKSDGSRGAGGSLYALGIGYSVTGVYYNKALAAKAGITSVPTTLADFEADLAQAKAAGQVPIMVGNQDFNGAFPLQAVQNQFDGLDKLKSWIYDDAGATYQLDSSVQAATTIQDWASKGYFPDDVNAIDYATSVGRFAQGQGVFMINGDWSASAFDQASPGGYGFFLFPGQTATSKHVAMAAPATYVVPATAKHKDVAAYFFNWVHTDAKARQIVLDITGSSPGGPADLPAPSPKAGTLAVDTVAAATRLAQEDGAIDFLGNATPGILTSTLGPDLQLLLTQRMTPQDLVSGVQKAYVTELGR
ncbi:ABC transporter substrate-binding protein [Cellulomonas citrea]|uniref:ABC transporter substrate-binding protein n=1 Tax=Cellulomonas citrea TaxID=1909423 RepID=UPI00135CB62F|nr:extracellular solute-binding protein [Cellulomonas citrea]